MLTNNSQSTAEVLQQLDSLSKLNETKALEAETAIDDRLDKLSDFFRGLCAGNTSSFTVPEMESLQSFTRKSVKQTRIAMACRNILRSLAFEHLNYRYETIHEAHARTFQWIFETEDASFREWAAKKSGKSLEESYCSQSTKCDRHLLDNRKTRFRKINVDEVPGAT